MNRMLGITLAAGALLLAPLPALAADGYTLPDICKAPGMAGMDMSPAATSHGGHGDTGSMDAAHADLMAGMDEMNSLMAEGMAADDIDVAFICGMIPHHQGAIDMARAQLKHGADPWAKQLATSIIATQQQEIKDMLDWLAKRQ